ncbi:hypothetical protein KRR26_29175 [Corallococcus sp. M34]|uniref:hypothetical protein n=1 Tax=Citreicoccus inhibens TaxID=2849499 RepID=UPI001C217B5A|nr:hypothetical protein [Citreicoccus inhibens]MBU8899690.1 hypothetical protein [Citreicoccus inhibens]
MLRALLVLLALVWAPAASAQCLGDGVQLFPTPGAVVPTNTRFLLEGVGTARSPVSALPGRTVRLSAPGHSVELKVTRGWESSLGRVTVVLQASEPLQPGKRYEMHLDSVLPNVTLLNGRGSGLPGWLTGKGPDKSPPLWQKKPAVSEGFFRRSAQGISRFVKLNLALREESPSYLVVKLTPRRAGIAPQTYVLPVVQGNAAFLGHESCGGAFALEDGRSYRARVDAFDAAGNPAPGTASVDFEAPSAQTAQQ